MLKQGKPQTKADKAQSQLFWAELQQMPNSGAIASKDGKRYLRRRKG